MTRNMLKVRKIAYGIWDYPFWVIESTVRWLPILLIGVVGVALGVAYSKWYFAITAPLVWIGMGFVAHVIHWAFRDQEKLRH